MILITRRHSESLIPRRRGYSMQNGLTDHVTLTFDLLTPKQ